MPLINTLADYKKYLKIAGTVNIDSLLPFINDAQGKHEYLRRWLGADLLALLEEYYNDSEATPVADLDALLPYVQNVLAKFAMYLAIPALDLQITEGGFAVIANQNLSPASQARVESLRSNMLQQGWDAVEELLRFLEEGQESYADWVSSEGYTETFSNFVRNAAEFTKIVNINGSRLKFQELRPLMDNVDMLQIEPAISKDLADEIRTQLQDGELEPEIEKIFPMLQRAEANLAAFDAGMGDQYRILGLNFLALVKRIIDENIEDYPIYAESDVYTASRTAYNTFDNEEDNKIFVFGN